VLAVTPGSYRLRVAAIDVDGRQGAAEGAIEAGLTEVGALSLGSLMLGVSRNASTALQLEFGLEPTATASFDIYGGTAGLPCPRRSRCHALWMGRRSSPCRSF
jgi:hypothetical protein